MQLSLIRASILLVLTLLIYNPSDHEALSESPTESSQMIPPADDVAPLAPPPKPVKAVAKAESKSEVSDVKPTQVDKPQSIAVTATFYTSKCLGCSGITKTGDDVRKTIYANGYRVIAVDPSVIPLRSIVRVDLADGQSFEAVASDIGGGIKNKRIDVLVASKREAYRLGVQQATVMIIKRGE